jgi:hypothetical protein
VLLTLCENRQHIQGVPETERGNVTKKQTINKKEGGGNTESSKVRIIIWGPFAVN